MKKIVQHLQKR